MNSDGRNPKCPLSTTHVLLSVQLSTKYKIRMSNLCAQHDTVPELKHRDIVTCMRVNAVRTVLQLALVTHGHLLRVRLGATKGTYIPIVLPAPALPPEHTKVKLSLSTDSSSDIDESKAVHTTPQAGWDKDTGWVGGQDSPHSHRNNKRLGREREGGGCQEQSWGGVELGPRWQNFRYLCYATLIAVLPTPALPPEHTKAKLSLSTDSTFSARACAPHLCLPLRYPSHTPGRVTETPGGADHFRQPFIPLISCLYPHLSTSFGLADRLSPRL